MKRALKYTVLSLAALIVVVVAALAFIAGTETGTRWAWNLARDFLPEGLTVRSVEGRLLGPLSLQGVELDADGFRLRVDDFELRLSPARLLTRRTLAIDLIAARGVRYTRLGATPKRQEASGKFKLPERIDLPLDIRLKARVRDVRYRASPRAEPVIVRTAGLAASLLADRLKVDRINIDSPLLALNGSSRLTTSRAYPLAGKFTWRARPPDYPPVHARTVLDGSLLRQLTIDQNLTAPYSAKARVALSAIFTRPRVRADVALRQIDLKAIKTSLPPITLSADITGQGEPDDLAVVARVSALEPRYGTLNLALAGELADQIVSIDKLVLSSEEQPARLAAAGRIALADRDAQVDLDARWRSLRWPLSGKPLVESDYGHVDVAGRVCKARARLKAFLGGAALEKAGMSEKQKIKANVEGGFAKKLLTIDEFELALAEQDTRLTAAGRVALDGEQPRIDLDLGWDALQWPLEGTPMITSPRGTLSVNGTPADVRANLIAAVGDTGRIEGNVKREDENIDLAFAWRELRWPLGAPEVISPAGGLELTGRFDNYALQAQASIDVPEKTGARIDLAGQGSLESLHLTRIDVEALQGQLMGAARVAWRPALQGAVNLKAKGVNPGELLAGWPGKLGLRLNAQAETKGDQLIARVEQLDIGGRLRRRPVALNARGAYDARGLELETLSLASGASEFSAQGLIGETLDLAWRVDSPDLSQLLPEASGRLEGEGRAQGPLRRPLAVARLSGAELAYRTFHADDLKLDADVDLSGKSLSRLDFDLIKGAAGAIAVKRIALHGEGDPGRHSFSLTARTGKGDADVSLAGALAHPWRKNMLWRFDLNEATLKYPRLAPWRVSSPITGLVSAAHARLSHGCWVSGQARLCLQGERTQAGVHANVQLEDLAFDYFARLLPRDTRVEGGLSARAEIEVPKGGQLAAEAHLRTTGGRVASVGIPAQTRPTGTRESSDELSKPLTLVAFRPNSIDFSLGDHGVELIGALRLLREGGIRFTASVPEGAAPLMERPLTGRITADMPNLGFVDELATEVGRFEGRLQGDMRLSGMLNAPEIRGRLALLDSLAVLTGPGLRIMGLRAELTGTGGGGIQLDAHARSGGGELDVRGEMNLADPAAPKANIHIVGRQFQVFNTADARVFISPALRVAARTGRLRITGLVRVPRAEITPEQLPESAVTVSSDQVIVETGADEKTTESEALKVFARIRLILGDEVDVEAFGLTGSLEGELLVIEEPGEPTRGAGELSILEGQYQAYGQNLVIETGKVLFPGGPISEPGLDVRAIRGDLQGQGVRVGVDVRGSLKQPVFNLFSQPAMSQQDQLSYLVLGHPPGESSGAEGALLAQAALALGLKGGNFLAENIGAKLGVDEIGIESEPTQGGGEQAALVIGEYLSPKLYVSYAIGLLEPISTVRLEYFISNQWHLVTESSGAESGGDLIYTIERGQ